MRQRTMWVESLLIMSCSLFALAGCGQERALATSSMNKGLQELSGGSTSKAVELMDEAFAKDKTFADPAYYMGLAYHQKFKSYEKAVDYYRKALKRAPENAQFLYQLGSALASMDKHNEAIVELTSAVKKEPTFSKAWFRLGRSQVMDKRYTEGVASLMKSIEAEPDMKVAKGDPGGAAYHELGDLYLRFRLYDKAIKVYENGIANNPKVSRLYRGLGVAQYKLKRYDTAIASLSKAIELDSSGAASYFNLAVAQREAKRPKEALKTLDLYLRNANASTERIRMSAAGGLRAELMAELEAKKP